MPSFTIYRTSKGGQDLPVGEMNAASATAALEAWAEHTGIEDFSIDQQHNATRVVLCPARGVLFFYAYEWRYVFVRDLPVTADGSFLYCSECGGEFSSTPGDYFWMGADEPFRCGECGEPLRLVKRDAYLIVVAGEREW